MLALTLFILPFVGSLVVASVRYERKREVEQGKRRPNFDEDKELGSWAAALSIADGIVIGFLILFDWMFASHELWTMLKALLLGLLIEGLLVGLMAGWFNGKRFLVWSACLLLVVGVNWVTGGWRRSLSKITMQESISYRNFTPFVEESPVAALDEPSALRFDNVNTAPRMDGAEALYPVYAAFAQATYPESVAGRSVWEIQKLVPCSNTAGAYRSIVNGDCDVIFVPGPTREQEAYAAAKGVELVCTPIGSEAFVFFVHPDNPLEGLSLEQIRDIYSGRITRWRELGAKGLGKILAYQRSVGTDSQAAMKRMVMGDRSMTAPIKEKVPYANMLAEVKSQASERISDYKNLRGAIGYSFRFACTGQPRDFEVKLLAVDGAAPTTENIRNGSYPLTYCFYAVTRADADENTLALLEWITGPQGQELVEKAGYTPLAADGD